MWVSISWCTPFRCYWNCASTTCGDCTFNEFPVVFGKKSLACTEHVVSMTSGSFGWCYVVEMNYYASVLLYEFEILFSNYSMAWLYNSFAISWYHPIITCCCNFADDSHSRRSWHRSEWWWWSSTTTASYTSRDDGPTHGDPIFHGRSAARSRVECWPGTRKRPAPRTWT